MNDTAVRRAGRASLTLALTLGTACAQGADDLTDLPLEQLLDVPVVSASRFEQKASETTAIVSVVSRDDIRQYGWRTLAEVLRSLHGFYTHNDRGYDYVGARGFARACVALFLLALVSLWPANAVRSPVPANSAPGDVLEVRP